MLLIKRRINLTWNLVAKQEIPDKDFNLINFKCSSVIYIDGIKNVLIHFLEFDWVYKDIC